MMVPDPSFLLTENVHFATRLAMAYLAAVGAAMSISVLWKLHTEGDQAMVSFQLNPGQAVEDFKIMMVAEGFMILGFLIYALGGLAESTLFLNIGRIYGVIFSLFVLRVYYRWWSRF